MKHELKIWPEFFWPVLERRKNFEIRVNDRGFQAGDTVVLKEWNPKKDRYFDDNPIDGTVYVKGDYTGCEAEFKIGYVLPIDDKRVVFSLIACDPSQKPESTSVEEG